MVSRAITIARQNSAACSATCRRFSTRTILTVGRFKNLPLVLALKVFFLRRPLSNILDPKGRTQALDPSDGHVLCSNTDTEIGRPMRLGGTMLSGSRIRVKREIHTSQQSSVDLKAAGVLDSIWKF
jgi:hypothetical protein